jgi:hypothetical protein
MKSQRPQWKWWSISPRAQHLGGSFPPVLSNKAIPDLLVLRGSHDQFCFDQDVVRVLRIGPVYGLTEFIDLAPKKRPPRLTV